MPTFNFKILTFAACKSLCCAAMATLGFSAATSQAATVGVHTFGNAGWYSSDTRDSTGVRLFGQTKTHPTLNAINGGSVAGDDAKIDERISFVTGPAGSLGEKGSVKLNATDQNAGKAHLSVFDAASGFGMGSDLLEPSFTTSYRYYNEPAPTSRTVGLSISLTDIASSTSYYTLSYVGVSVVNDWTTNTADSTSAWRLYGNGVLGAAPGGPGPIQSLADWANHPTFGPIFTGDYSIYEVGFNLGSSQRQNNTYVDWFQSSLTNGGNLVDFQAVPEPSTVAILGLASVAGIAVMRRRRA